MTENITAVLIELLHAQAQGGASEETMSDTLERARRSAVQDEHIFESIHIGVPRGAGSIYQSDLNQKAREAVDLEEAIARERGKRPRRVLS